MSTIEQRKHAIYKAILEALHKIEPQIRAGGEFFGTNQRKEPATLDLNGPVENE